MKSLVIMAAITSLFACQQVFAGADPYAHQTQKKQMAVSQDHGTVVLPRSTRYYTTSETGNMALNQLVNRVYSDLHLIDDANVEIVYQPGYEEIAERLQNKLDERFVDSALKTANNTSLRMYPVYVTVRGWYGPQTRCQIVPAEYTSVDGCSSQKTLQHTRAVSKR